MIDISIVSPVYNVEKYLSDSVESMLAQTFTNIEIILVDDGSTDSSGKMCEDFGKKDSRIKVIHKKNGGVSSARNAGMDIAEGKYIYFCDPDDIINPNLIYDNFKLMERHSAEVCVFGCDFFEDIGGRIVKQRSYCPAAEKCLDLKGFWDNFPEERRNGNTLCCRMFLRSYIVKNNIRFRDFEVGEDTLFLYDVYEYGFNRIVYNNNIYYSYIKRKGGAMSVYKADRLKIACMAADRFKEVVERCDPVKGRYEDIIYRSYVDAVSGGFRYLTALSPLKMYAVVKEYMEKDVIKEGFSRLDIKSVQENKSRVRMFFLKHRMFLFYVIISYFYSFLKKLKQF